MMVFHTWKFDTTVKPNLGLIPTISPTNSTVFIRLSIYTLENSMPFLTEKYWPWGQSKMPICAQAIPTLLVSAKLDRKGFLDARHSKHDSFNTNYHSDSSISDEQYKSSNFLDIHSRSMTKAHLP